MSEFDELVKKYMEQGAKIDHNLLEITKILEARLETLEAKVEALEAGKEQ